MKEKEIFVFGSNLAGVHGAGAALYARKHAGAINGIGIGLQGSSYAIPTKDERIKTLPLHEIRAYVEDFLVFAAHHPEWRFLMTRIGCGLAGYKDKDIAPMFAKVPSNVVLPPEWVEFLRRSAASS
jgi:hypothetical protein